VARRLGRPFVDVDRVVEAEHGPIPELFAARGEAAFRELEASALGRLLDRREDLVVSLGGGAIETSEVRERLRVAFTVVLEVDADTAWRRVRGSDRPLARDEPEFRARYERRQPLYREVADAVARDADDVVLAAAGVHVGLGALELLGSLVPGDGPVALVTDPHVAGIHGAAAQLALGGRLVSTHQLSTGEDAKTLRSAERLFDELRLDRSGTLVALGGGCVTDAAGFVAATHLRGIPWVTVPTTLVGQVDAGIGGKTALNLPQGKNLVGAFHWPVRTVLDPALLETLPERERREGRAEVVKTGLLAGEELWELPGPELVRRCAAFKAGVCLSDPTERGDRAQLNLGHTFAHALEAGSDQAVSHGQAVALGLLAALRLSGLPTGVVERTLRPRPVRADPDRAWAALRRDKKSVGGSVRLVLLEAPGKPRIGVEVPETDVRRALNELIAQ
jgi:shikimate kinase/3-dehydroquinate synthase